MIKIIDNVEIPKYLLDAENIANETHPTSLITYDNQVIGFLTKELVDEMKILDIYISHTYKNLNLEESIKSEFYGKEVLERLSNLKNGLVIIK